jgi:uncharacterized membrane protein YqjE
MEQSDSKNPIKKLSAELKHYVETRLEIASLEYQEKFAGLISALISDGVGLFLIVLGFLFILVSTGLALGYLVGNMALGFLILALLLIMPGMYIYKFKRNKFKRVLKEKISAFIDRNLRDKPLD